MLKWNFISPHPLPGPWFGLIFTRYYYRFNPIPAGGGLRGPPLDKKWIYEKYYYFLTLFETHM